MNEYSVTVLVDASRNYTVKAESPEAAIERAEELYSGESSGLCHHCSGKLDVGGAVGAIAYCEDKEVLDTSYQASRIATLEAECEKLRKEKSARQALSIQLIDEARALRAELAAIKGREPVAIANKGNGVFWVKWTDAGESLRGPGIKLYTLPAAPEGGEA